MTGQKVKNHKLIKNIIAFIPMACESHFMQFKAIQGGWKPGKSSLLMLLFKKAMVHSIQ